MYKANWNNEPMVYIASRRAIKRKLAVTDIKVYSNCQVITLKVNGETVGCMQPDDIKVCFFNNVLLKKGSNQIEAIGSTVQGNELVDTCEWILE